MNSQTKKNLDFVKNALIEVAKYDYAQGIAEFDQRTICPKNAQADMGAVSTMLSEHRFRITKDPDFRKAAEFLNDHIQELDEWDAMLAKELHRQFLRSKNISPEMNANFEQTKNDAWVTWTRAREANDFSLYADSIDRVITVEKQRVSLWETPTVADGKDLSHYERMLDEHERGMTCKTLDKLFEEAKKRLLPLLDRIINSPRSVRTDFLYRSVSDEQQQKMTKRLLELTGFNLQNGAFTPASQSFMSRLGPRDVRVTASYNSRNFLSGFYSILHEAGHALFEQLQPSENHAHFIADVKTIGQHESVSRFYENTIGRSRSFIHLIYPDVCEFFPQVMADVTEDEFYEAVNFVTPSLIRKEADELTAVIHSIIRYEIEKELIDGHLSARELPALWNEKHETYLGVSPQDDCEGVLQDVHWSLEFGYFPADALGSFYNAMFSRKMREDFDVNAVIESGDFRPITKWMKENVYQYADRLSPAEWIQKITGRALTADDFLTYLETKYTALYGLSDADTGNIEFTGYVRRMARIQVLSSPQLYNIDTTKAYSALLHENYKSIGELAAENRAVISNMIDPILSSKDALPEDLIENIRKLNENLMDAYQRENIDLPVMALLSDRLKQDAILKRDEKYLIQQLDEEIIACYALVVQTMRITIAPEICEEVRERGLKAYEQLMSYLSTERFLSLDEDCKEIIMINSRYGNVLYETMIPQSKDIRQQRISGYELSLQLADDPHYRDALPSYDWRYHRYRCHDYMSHMDEYGNAAGCDAEDLATILEHGKLLESMWRSDPTYFEGFDNFRRIHCSLLRNLFHTGQLSRQEYCSKLLSIYDNRNPKAYDEDDIFENITVPAEYILALKGEDLTEQEREKVREIYQSSIGYIFHMKKTGKFYELLENYAPLIFSFIEVPGGVTFETLCIQLLAAFHPPTYIHSTMVAMISRCLAAHIIRECPELFVGICGCPSEAEVPHYAARIIDYTYHAALCHDFGKLIIIDTVYVYGRKILDFEFNIIKQHPEMGASMMEQYASTRDYADVARGHHKFCDNTRGYPQYFDTEKSPVKTIIDIVACADSMDAATDTVGRSYNKGKTFDEFAGEVKDGAGTRYAIYFPALFEMPEVKRDLEYLLTEGRQKVYHQTYQLLRSVNDGSE